MNKLDLTCPRCAATMSYGMYWGNLTTVKSWRGAMLYEDFESAVRAVESEQSSKEEVSIRSF